MIIHESIPNIPVPTPKRLKREHGYRNVMFGKQKKLWHNTVKQHRAIQAHHATENVNNIGNENIYPVNISGSNWIIEHGESSSNTIPKNLLPPPRVFRSRGVSRKLRRRYGRVRVA